MITDLAHCAFAAGPGADVVRGGSDGRHGIRRARRERRFTKAATVPPVSGVKDLVQIYELALAGWPAGEYKIKVNVTDNHSGAFDEREVLFHIE